MPFILLSQPVLIKAYPLNARGFILLKNTSRTASLSQRTGCGLVKPFAFPNGFVLDAEAETEVAPQSSRR